VFLNRFNILLLVLLALAGCDNTEYRFIAPEGPEAVKSCAGRCREAWENCKRREEKLFSQCMSLHAIQSSDYRMCEHGRGNIAAACLPPDICPLPDKDMCLDHFISCWQDCGGTVELPDRQQKP
jgi:hypothetical protein